MAQSPIDCLNCTVVVYEIMAPQTEDDAFQIILLVLVPCIIFVSILLCCARIFYVYYSYRRERMHRLPTRRRVRIRRRREEYHDYVIPSVSVIDPPPNYDQVVKQVAHLPPPAYTNQTIRSSEMDSPLPPHYTPTEEVRNA
ncbi:hypothetical protein PFISCL1PPCAC_10155 [Pristionchus fissidentatus]|uniref:Uncharacterized protein n=1 Tax=Pristionchus fissidentatus TaxID=1538716 RepID=A0AAV5VHP5_9BILA|nr:hypothetical protein PFISCL1PPCAC_10155 [Pristionchus fissidentatus]